VTALIKKEIREILKTYRLWVLPVFFLFLGFSAPASAKFLPDILSSQLRDQNITLKLPEPSDFEAFQTYFKNLAQMGLLAVVLFTMGLISEEKSSGVLAQVVVKPVGRSAIVFAKWAVNGFWFILSLAIGAVGCYLYTLALFGQADLGRFITANLLFCVYLILIFSLSLAASAALPNQLGAGAVGLAGFFVLSLIPLLGGRFERFSPATLNRLAVEALSGKAEAVLAPILVSLILTVVFLFIGGFIFNRQEL
jgi:ABC-2 type transport system permease protein